MSKMLVKCLKCLQTNADNTVAAGGQGVGWAYCPSSCPVEGKLLCDNDKKNLGHIVLHLVLWRVSVSLLLLVLLRVGRF